MKTFALILCLICCMPVGAQGTAQELMRKREELHRRLIEGLLKGQPGDQEELMREMEGMMEELLRDVGQADSLSRRADPLDTLPKGLSLSWSQTQEGRVLKVTPADKAAKLDVQVLKGVVTIRSELSQGSLRSQFSRTQAVPGDCDGDRVKMDAQDGQLILMFPWKTKDVDNFSEKEHKPLKMRGTKVDV